MSKAIAIDRGREIGLGYLYWLTFLIALGPSDLLHGEDVLRIALASLLGAAAIPLVLAVMRRYPVEAGPRLVRHLGLHAATATATGFTLIVVSCVLAPVVQLGDTRPFATALPSQLSANWLLLTFSMVAFMGLAQAVRLLRRAPEGCPALVSAQPSPAFRASVAVKSSNGPVDIAVQDIDWIETQGNYIALHVGARAHLVRETLVNFEAELDPALFVRVHRRALVALDRVEAVEKLGNGDAALRLRDGTTLRMSRSYTGKFRAVSADARANIRA